MWAAAAVLVAWVQLSEAGARQKCFEITGKYAVACAVVGEAACTIYSPKIRNDRDNINFARLGEEVAHCFLGDFHQHGR
jgi:hypothetical protein